MDFRAALGLAGPEIPPKAELNLTAGPGLWLGVGFGEVGARQRGEISCPGHLRKLPDPPHVAVEVEVEVEVEYRFGRVLAGILKVINGWRGRLVPGN